MDTPALVEQDVKNYDIGYIILDITKHALITIIEKVHIYTDIPLLALIDLLFFIKSSIKDLKAQVLHFYHI